MEKKLNYKIYLPLFKISSLDSYFQKNLIDLKENPNFKNKREKLEYLENNFKLNLGLNKIEATQLVKYSTNKEDLALQKGAGDMKRFRYLNSKDNTNNIGSYEEWYQKGKWIYSLIDKRNNKLAGIIWFSQSKNKKEHGLAFRMYDIYRGKGIAKLFGILCIKKHLTYFENFNVRLDVAKENEAGKKLYESMKFEDSKEAFIKEKNIFIKSNINIIKQIRLEYNLNKEEFNNLIKNK